MRQITGVNAETATWLSQADHAAMRHELAQSPLAAAALRHCASLCFPPTATAGQVERLERMLRRVQRSGPYNETMLQEFLYSQRTQLEQALSFIEVSSSARELEARIGFVASGRTPTIGPSPEQLPHALAQRSEAVGVARGRVTALAEGYQDARYVNPFEHIGGYGQGFDDILRAGAAPGAGHVIAEYKGGGAGLSEGQMGIAWVVRNIQRLYREGGAEGRELAIALAADLRNGRLIGVVYSTPVVDGVAGATVRVAGPGSLGPSPWTYPRTRVPGVP
jgi:hypothetical protein